MSCVKGHPEEHAITIYDPLQVCKKKPSASMDAGLSCIVTAYLVG